VRLSVRRVYWQNGELDLDAIVGGEWGQSRDGCISWVDIIEGEVAGLGLNVGHPIATNRILCARGGSSHITL